jgi:hypothetical protein
MSLSQFATGKLVTRKRATWALTASLLLVSFAQPTAQGLDFPTTTRLNLPDGPAAKVTITKDADLNQAVAAPISEMALVAAMARQVELARKSTGAKYVARTIMLAEYSWISTAASIVSGLKRATGTTRLITLALEHMEFRRPFLLQRWMSSELIGAQIQ